MLVGADLNYFLRFHYTHLALTIIQYSHPPPPHTHTHAPHTQGVVLHSTQSVQPPHTPLKSIVECAGGELLNLPELRSRFGRRLERASTALIVISTPEDMAAGLCSEFITLGLSEWSGTCSIIYCQ